MGFAIAKEKNVISVNVEKEKEVKENVGVEMLTTKSDAENVKKMKRKQFTLVNPKEVTKE